MDGCNEPASWKTRLFQRSPPSHGASARFAYSTSAGGVATASRFIAPRSPRRLKTPSGPAAGINNLYGRVGDGRTNRKRLGSLKRRDGRETRGPGRRRMSTCAGRHDDRPRTRRSGRRQESIRTSRRSSRAPARRLVRATTQRRRLPGPIRLSTATGSDDRAMTAEMEILAKPCVPSEMSPTDIYVLWQRTRRQCGKYVPRSL